VTHVYSLDARLYAELKRYVLTERELVENGYPRSSPGGVISIRASSMGPQTSLSREYSSIFLCRTKLCLISDGNIHVRLIGDLHKVTDLFFWKPLFKFDIMIYIYKGLYILECYRIFASYSLRDRIMNQIAIRYWAE